MTRRASRGSGPGTLRPAGSNVAVPGGRLRTGQAGSGPAVLFVHAGIGDSRMWGQADDRAGHYHVIRYGQRGFGKPSAPDAPYSPVAEVDAVPDHAGADRAALAGCAGLPADRPYYHLSQLERAGLIEVTEYRPLAHGKVEDVYAPAKAEPPGDAASPGRPPRSPAPCWRRPRWTSAPLIKRIRRAGAGWSSCIAARSG